MQQVKTAVSQRAEYCDSPYGSDGEQTEILALLTMEPIGEMSQNLVGFKPFLLLTEFLGVLLFVMMIIWCTYYRGGFTWTSNPDLQFNWHPFLMVLGMVLLYSQSILLYRMFRTNRKRKLKTAHAIIHGLAFVAVVVALRAIFDNHNLTNKPNLYSLHSWMGLTTVILFACQFVAGFVSFLFPGLKMQQRALYMPVHVFFGLAGFIFAIASCLMGLTETAIFKIPNYSAFVSEGLFVNFIGVTLIVFASLVVYLVTKIDYRRIAKEEDGH